LLEKILILKINVFSRNSSLIKIVRVFLVSQGIRKSACANIINILMERNQVVDSSERFDRKQ